jgi:glycosyltransferase involved in cell wall biosynthesis
MLELARRPGSPHADLDLVVFQHDDFRWLFPLEDNPRVRVVRSGQSGLGPARRRLLQQTVVPGMARRSGVDLVHSLNNVMPLRLGVPGVLTVLDLSPFVLPARFGLAKRTFLRWMVPRSIRAAAAVIAISENTRSQILRRAAGVSPDRVHAIPLGVDRGFHCRRETVEEERLASRLALPASFALYVGAAEPGKNLLGITRALEIVKERHGLDVPWVLAGVGGRHLADLERVWSRSPIRDHVRVVGVLADHDLRRLYRMAKVFVFPSLYEGFGLPLLEAFASGVPAITSRGDSALPEVAGRAALTVDPTDPEAIARAIVRVWGHEEVRELLRRRGLERAARFDWCETAERTLGVYREVLARRATAGTPALRRAAAAV